MQKIQIIKILASCSLLMELNVLSFEQGFMMLHAHIEGSRNAPVLAAREINPIRLITKILLYFTSICIKRESPEAKAQLAKEALERYGTPKNIMYFMKIAWNKRILPALKNSKSIALLIGSTFCVALCIKVARYYWKELQLPKEG